MASASSEECQHFHFANKTQYHYLGQRAGTSTGTNSIHDDNTNRFRQPRLALKSIVLTGTSDFARASTMSQEGPGCHHCRLVWKVLQPGDNFMCSHCGVNGSNDDQGTTNQNIDASEEPPPSTQPPSSNSQLPSWHVQDIFQQIAAGSSKPRSQSVAVARSEALETFSGAGKAAQYQKLARGPTLALGKVWTSSPEVSPSSLHGTQA